MGLIKIKRNRCPKKKDDDDKKKECKGFFVPIIKMLALAWIISLGILILAFLGELFVFLIEHAYYKNSDKIDGTLNGTKILTYLCKFFAYPALIVFVVLSCLFIVLYVICLIVDFLKWILLLNPESNDEPIPSPLVFVPLPQITVPLYLFVVFFKPICCALWEAGIFAIIEALVKALFGGGDFDLGRIFSLERLRKVANNESDEESIKTFFCKPESPVKVNIIDDSDTSNSNAQPKFPIDEKMKQIEYQNCLAKYKEESSVDSATAFVLNTLHELKCYQKVMPVGINSYNEGTCVKREKSILTKGLESIGSAKRQFMKTLDEANEAATCPSTTTCTSNEASNLTYCSNLMICDITNHSYCSNRSCRMIESDECTDISFTSYKTYDINTSNCSANTSNCENTSNCSANTSNCENTSNIKNCSSLLIYSKKNSNSSNDANSSNDTNSSNENNDDDDVEKYIENWLRSIKCKIKNL
jgi:hypothetical protein